jgi:hypothetical protein
LGTAAATHALCNESHRRITTSTITTTFIASFGRSQAESALCGVDGGAALEIGCPAAQGRGKAAKQQSQHHLWSGRPFDTGTEQRRSSRELNCAQAHQVRPSTDLVVAPPPRSAPKILPPLVSQHVISKAMHGRSRMCACISSFPLSSNNGGIVARNLSATQSPTKVKIAPPPISPQPRLSLPKVPEEGQPRPLAAACPVSNMPWSNSGAPVSYMVRSCRSNAGGHGGMVSKGLDHYPTSISPLP